MINHESEIPIKELNSSELKNVKKQILVGPNDGFDGFLREFSVGEGDILLYIDMIGTI